MRGEGFEPPTSRIITPWRSTVELSAHCGAGWVRTTIPLRVLDLDDRPVGISEEEEGSPPPF